MSKESVSSLPIWKTIKLGTGLRTADDFRKAFMDCGMQISLSADDILAKPELKVAVEETEIDLIKVTDAELGFEEKAGCDVACQCAKELGLELCPPEVGPQLRLQYKDQSSDEEHLLLGMEPICDSDNHQQVFDVVRYDPEGSSSGLVLDAIWAFLSASPMLARSWLFVRPRKQ